ncbi:MAG: ATP-binding protein, partial [Candidatus Hodarchaeota archaeon]
NEKYEHEFINEQTYMNILGYSNEDMLGKTRVDIVHPDDVERALNAYKKGFQTGEGTVEARLRHKQGHYLWFEIKGKTYHDANGELKGLLVSREITDRKKAEQLILEENKKLIELDKMRSDLITRISHELKTPLTISYLASQILIASNEEIMDKNIMKLIQAIHRGNIRLKELIDNLLDASRIESERFILIKHQGNITEIINQCVDNLYYLINKRQLFLEINLPQEIQLEMDDIRIEQVFTNIISNAIKNTPIGGKIYINFVEHPDYFDFQIKDTGVGLTSEEKEKLFVKFGKIERYGMGLDVDIEGSGLGLFISKQIVEAHNGEILAESQGRNKGSTFTIRLFKN